VVIGPPGTKTRDVAEVQRADQQARHDLVADAQVEAASNILCDSAMAVDMAMVSRENSDSSMPGWPCVTPSHMAGTPPANWATAPIRARRP
jgi:hypothetical protein